MYLVILLGCAQYLFPRLPYPGKRTMTPGLVQGTVLHPRHWRCLMAQALDKQHRPQSLDPALGVVEVVWSLKPLNITFWGVNLPAMGNHRDSRRAIVLVTAIVPVATPQV